MMVTVAAAVVDDTKYPEPLATTRVMVSGPSAMLSFTVVSTTSSVALPAGMVNVLNGEPAASSGASV